MLARSHNKFSSRVYVTCMSRDPERLLFEVANTNTNFFYDFDLVGLYEWDRDVGSSQRCTSKHSTWLACLRFLKFNLFFQHYRHSSAWVLYCIFNLRQVINWELGYIIPVEIIFSTCYSPEATEHVASPIFCQMYLCFGLWYYNQA